MSSAKDKMKMIMRSPRTGTNSEMRNLLESKALFTVNGMTCSACAVSVEKAVKKLPGIKQTVVDVLGDRARVSYFPAVVDVSSPILKF